MNNETYVDKIIELASRCHTMAETTCQELRQQTAGEEFGWQGPNEPRELYFALQMLQHKADALLERAAILRSAYGAVRTLSSK
ncbi:MAG: hypothetical protein JO232_16445 [Verrucomicrobia bacterium]|nr:hypothetical protein [Verrucomicrobiota bacterium]